jgi:electron transport complex protein RnfB
MTRAGGLTRRQFLVKGSRLSAWVAVTGGAALVVAEASAKETVWQIDPQVCVACGNCAVHCVREHSAVRCVQVYEMCGYCDLCTAFFSLDHTDRTSGAENQLCPTGAVIRRPEGYPFFEYSIDERLCIGCGKCVKGCVDFGNGSLYLQIRHDQCLNCNECAIARHCPSGAVRRVDAGDPHRPKYRRPFR